MKPLLHKYTLVVGLVIIAATLLALKFIFGTESRSFPGILVSSPSPPGRTEVTNQEELRRREEEVRPLTEFLDQNPLIRNLPHREESFSIEYEPRGTVYIVHLLLHDDKPYREQQEQSRQDALGWIRSQGVDPDSLKIEYTTN